MSKILGIVAIIVALMSAVLYVKQLLTTGKKLSISTWTISSVVLMINAFVFHDLAESNWYESGNVFVVAFSVVFVTVWSWFTGQLTMVTIPDAVAVTGALGIGYFWFTGGDTALASGALVAVCGISLAMTVIGLVDGDLEDEPEAWFLTAISSVFQISAIYFNPDGWVWHRFMYPMAIGLVGNLTVALVIMFSVVRR